MTCSDFDVWLNEGRPEALATRARDHAAGCPRCAAEMRAAGAVDALLREERLEASPGTDFTPRVMARIRMLNAIAPRGGESPARDPLSWWVQAALEPSTLLGFFVAAFAIWQADAIATLFVSANARGGAFFQRVVSGEELPWIAASLGVFKSPIVEAVVTVTILAGLGWLSILLYRWSEKRIVQASR